MLCNARCAARERRCSAIAAPRSRPSPAPRLCSSSESRIASSRGLATRALPRAAVKRSQDFANARKSVRPPLRCAASIGHTPPRTIDIGADDDPLAGASRASSIASRVATGGSSTVRRRLSMFRVRWRRCSHSLCTAAGAVRVRARMRSAHVGQAYGTGNKSPSAERKLAHEARRAHRILGPRPQLPGPASHRAGGREARL